MSPGKDRAKVRLYSRPGNDLTYRFPVIVETVARCIIDGEAVEPADLGKLIAEDTEKWGNVIRAANIQGGVIYKGSTASAIIIEPMGSGLRGITFRYAHEVRSEAQYFADIPRIALPTRC